MARSAEPTSQSLVQRHFLIQEERPAEVREVEIASLDPFLRGLLFTDGTVTRALGVQTLAPVSVERLDQVEVPAPGDVAEQLEVEAGETLVRRRVRIGLGAPSPILWAESFLIPDRLPPGFMGLLDGAPDGIGQSLQRFALESSRELLWFGLDAPPRWAATGETGGSTIRRLYRVLSGHQASILIAESFAVEERAGVLHLVGLGRSDASGRPPEAGR